MQTNVVQRDRRTRQNAEIAARRQKVAALYRQHRTESEIAETLGVSTATVSRDVHAIMAQWRAQYLGDASVYVTRDLADLDVMERDAAEQFIRTLDSIWLLRRLQVKERRAKLLGLDVPAKVDLSVYVRERAAELGLDLNEAEQRVRGGLKLVS